MYVMFVIVVARRQSSLALIYDDAGSRPDSCLSSRNTIMQDSRHFPFYPVRLPTEERRRLTRRCI